MTLRSIRGASKRITALSETLAKRAGELSGAPQREPGVPPKRDQLIMLRDFDTLNRGNATIEAITNAGFAVPASDSRCPGRTSPAISITTRSPIAGRCLGRCGLDGRGFFDFFEQVYRSQDEASYAAERAA